MRRAALLALLSHWWRQPGQLVTLLAGLALATGLWSAVQAVNAEARASYARAEAQLGADRGQILEAPGGMIPLETYVRLRRAGWQVTPVLEGRVRLDGPFVTLMGVDLLNAPVAVAGDAAEGTPDEMDLADLFSGRGRLFVEPGTAMRIGADPSLPPVILSDQVPPGIVLTDIAVAERILDQDGLLSRLIVLPDQPMGLPPLAELVPDLSLRTPQGAAQAARLTDSFHLNLTAFGFLSFAVGLFIVHGMIGLAFEQRRPMLRTLRALGLPVRTLVTVLLGELLVLAIVAGGIGLILGYLVAAALLPDVAATLRGLYGVPAAETLSFRPPWALAGLGMAVAGTLLSGASSLFKLAGLPVLAMSGTQSWRMAARRNLRLMAGAGTAAILLGLAGYWLLDGLIGGFALLTGLLLSAAFLLPPCLSGVLYFVQVRAQAPVAQWVWSDLRRQLPGLSLALMALLLALAANVGVGTMVKSFRLVFVEWLDQRLAAEIYVTARDDAQAAALAVWLRDRGDVALPIRYATDRVNDAEVRIYGVADHATYRDHWPVIETMPGAWNRIAAGTAVLINEQLANRQGLGPGDVLTAAAGWHLPVAGIYADYGNPSGQVILSLSALLARYDDVPFHQLAVRAISAQPTDLARDIRTDFDLPATAVVDQAAIKASSLAVFDKTFIVTGVLNVLTLGVAGFAILTSLLTLWTIRLPQLAPVWALGLTRRRLGWLEVARSIALCAATVLLALPLGVLLAWILLSVINVQAFGWSLPMRLFPLDWLRLGALAVLAGAVAAAWPARRLQSVPPADLLKAFSNER